MRHANNDAGAVPENQSRAMGAQSRAFSSTGCQPVPDRASCAAYLIYINEALAASITLAASACNKPGAIPQRQANGAARR
jgi:hypothetical protein